MSRQGSVTARDAASPAANAGRPGELAPRMARSIWHYVCRHHMNAGNHLTELELVDALRVSRTPRRGALSYLAERGIVEHRPNRGYVLKVSSDETALDELELPETAEDRVLDATASEW